jgi:hypothetical protein
MTQKSGLDIQDQDRLFNFLVRWYLRLSHRMTVLDAKRHSAWQFYFIAGTAYERVNWE